MKELLKRKFDYLFDTDMIPIAIATVFCLMMLHFLYGVMHADRIPRGYYLSSESTSAGIAYRIKVSIDYTEDPIAFMTPDYKIALSTLEKLNK